MVWEKDVSYELNDSLFFSSDGDRKRICSSIFFVPKFLDMDFEKKIDPAESDQAAIDLVADSLVDENTVEIEYCNGVNETVKVFNLKYVICLERDSVYTFRQSGD